MFRTEESKTKKGEGEDDRQWGVREVKRPHFLDCDVFYVLSD